METKMRKIIMMVMLMTVLAFTAGCADFTREIVPNRDMSMDITTIATSEIPMMVQQIQTDLDLEGECITLDNGITCYNDDMFFVNKNEESPWGKSSYTKESGFWKNTYRMEINVSEVTNENMLEATDYGLSAKTTIKPFGKVIDTNMKKINLDGETQYIINMFEPDNYYLEFKDWRFKFW